MILQTPLDDPSPTSLGFSLNSFFVWIGNLNPLVQIPVVILVFGVVVALILVLIEYAPRAGHRLRDPAGGGLLRHPAPRVHAAAAVPGRGHLRDRDRPAREARCCSSPTTARDRSGLPVPAHHSSLAPAVAILLLIGLIYPDHRDVLPVAFFDKTGEQVRRVRELRLDVHQPPGVLVGHQHGDLGRCSLRPSRRSSASPTRSSSTGRAVSKCSGSWCSCRSAISSSAAGVIWKFVYDYRRGRPDRHPERCHHMVRRAAGALARRARRSSTRSACCAVFIWSQTGFAMVILSAAIEAVPAEQIEAAQLDGANAWERFTQRHRPRHPLRRSSWSSRRSQSSRR